MGGQICPRPALAHFSRSEGCSACSRHHCLHFPGHSGRPPPSTPNPPTHSVLTLGNSACRSRTAPPTRRRFAVGFQPLPRLIDKPKGCLHPVQRWVTAGDPGRGGGSPRAPVCTWRAHGSLASALTPGWSTRLTQFVSSSEGRLQPVVLHDSAAPSRVAHSAHVGHAQGVAGGDPAQVLWSGGGRRMRTPGAEPARWDGAGGALGLLGAGRQRGPAPRPLAAVFLESHARSAVLAGSPAG